MIDETLRLAALGDIHCGAGCRGTLQPIFEAAAEQADVLLLLGDLTKYGRPEEVQLLLEELRPALSIPVIAVLGNHDFETGNENELISILSDSGVRVLDGTSTTVDGVGFAGAKGFGGGFGRRALTPWGEPAIKAFVQASADEAMKLERALTELRTESKVVLLHYSPIHETIVGEPEQIAPFLGSTRLEEPIDRYRASIVFHGHAHYGSLQGKTKSGIPVYNVAMPLLSRHFENRPPFRIHEVPTSTPIPT